MCPELEFNRSAQERNKQKENREEGKELRDDKELKAAAAMERADFLSREVKSSQQQMQNIVIHLQQVIAAIKKLRIQLDLPGNEDVSSVEEDARRVAKLKIQIQQYRAELESMREELIREQAEDLIKQHPEMLMSDAENIAKQKVVELYAQLEE